MDPVLLGISTHGEEAERKGRQDDKKKDPTTVPMALVNDVHFWGLLPFTPARVRPEEDKDEEQADDDEKHPTGEDDPFVQRELKLGMALAEWNPWHAPTDELIVALSQFAADPLKHNASHNIIARRAVLSDLALERASAADADPHLAYQRAARWRLDKPQQRVGAPCINNGGAR